MMARRSFCVCLFDPKKGIPYLLQAVAALAESRQDFQLDIVGDGPNREEYQRISSELGLQGLVFFRGLRPKAEVAEFMRRSEIFVLPSLWETQGVVLLEAMASGLPIVATYTGGVPEMITDSIGRLVPPGDAGALQTALLYMLDHYQEYNREEIAGQAFERYSYEAVGNTLSEIYESCLRWRKGTVFECESPELL